MAINPFFSSAIASEENIDILHFKMLTAKQLISQEKSEIEGRKKYLKELEIKHRAEGCSFEQRKFSAICFSIRSRYQIDWILLESYKYSLEETQNIYNGYKEKYLQALGQRIAELALQKFYQRAAEEKEMLVERKRRSSLFNQRTAAKKRAARRKRAEQRAVKKRAGDNSLRDAIRDAANALKRQQGIATGGRSISK